MIQEEILEYNKRCALILGAKCLSPKTKYSYFDFGENWSNLPIFQQTIHSNMLQFHSNWNWIMEVVEAIEKLDNFYVQIEESACYIYDISKFTDEQCNPFISCDLRLNSKKEAVVQAINQFLIWYNENKKL